MQATTLRTTRPTLDSLPGAAILALVVGALAPGQGAGAASGLWVCHLAPTEARLVFWDENELAPSVGYGIRGEATRRVGASAGPLRSVVLTDLRPGTVYDVACEWRRTSFQTPDANESRLRIGLLGHTGGTHGAQRYQPEQAIDRIRAMRPDMVLHAGDAIYTCAPSSFHTEFLRQHDAIMRHVPVYLAPGNHEAGWPRNRQTYAAFRSSLPYPYDPSVTDDDVFYVVERGSVRLIFLSYYRGRLMPGKPQRKWLDRVLKERTKPFTVLVGGFSPGTFPERDAFLRSLPGGAVDLIIGGDADGCRIHRGPGIPFAYIGSGGSGAHPYGLLEVEPHRLVVNAYDIAGRHRGNLKIRDRSTYRVRHDVLGALGRADYKVRTTAVANEDGSATYVPTEPPKPVTVLSNIPAVKDLRGFQMDVRIEPRQRTSAHQNVFIMWVPDGDNPPLHRSQPFHVPMDGRSHRLTIPFPAIDPTSGKPSAPERIGFRMIDPSPNLARLTITRAYLF